MSAFCSRNAHDRYVLVRRPQSGLTRVPFQRGKDERVHSEFLATARRKFRRR
jgi:hypothetical protein